MTVLVKTVKADQLPHDWQAEMGLAADAQVRVAIEELRPSRAPEVIMASLERLRRFKPISIDGDVTNFIRSERDRLDGRNSR